MRDTETDYRRRDDDRREREISRSSSEKQNEVCRDFLRGECKRGANCSWIHSRDAPKKELCRDYSRGKCLRGDSCPYLHERSRPDSRDSRERRERSTEYRRDDRSEMRRGDRSFIKPPSGGLLPPPYPYMHPPMADLTFSQQQQQQQTKVTSFYSLSTLTYSVEYRGRKHSLFSAHLPELLQLPIFFSLNKQPSYPKPIHPVPSFLLSSSLLFNIVPQFPRNMQRSSLP